MQIREIASQDRVQWEPLWAGYNAFYGREGPTALPDEITESTWRRLLAVDEPVHALVADTGGSLVGVVHYIFHRNTILIGNTCYLQDLFTAPEARGIGVGRALIEGVYAAAATAGAVQVYWHTQESNTTARLLYDKLAVESGFVVYRKNLAIEATQDGKAGPGDNPS